MISIKIIRRAETNGDRGGPRRLERPVEVHDIYKNNKKSRDQ